MNIYNIKYFACILKSYCKNVTKKIFVSYIVYACVWYVPMYVCTEYINTANMFMDI